MSCNGKTHKSNSISKNIGGSVVALSPDDFRQQEAVESLRNVLPEGTKIYTEVTKVSRSGTSRHINFYRKDEDGVMVNISRGVANATKNKYDADGMVYGGVGFDTTLFSVADLSRALHGNEKQLENVNLFYDKKKDEYRAEGSIVKFY